ncbi:MAG: hypothetical protein IKK51_08400 [Oscillospiraceae bacterium]|nr:hypothetical protein [Oscillospiraceae bacterium]
MKMEMSYRDKMVLLVVGVIVILVGGFFALIKPKYDDMKANKAAYVKTQETWTGIKREIDAIPTYKNKITEIYNESKDTAKIFINTAFTSANADYAHDHTAYELDQYIQPAVDASNVEITSMKLDDVSAQKIEYYYHIPNVLTYSLLEAADVNGNYAKEVAEVLKSGIVLETRETAELQTVDVEMTVNGTKESLMKFLEGIDSDKNAILVNEVAVENYQFTDGLELDEYGDPMPGENLEEGTSIMLLNIRFFSAKEVDQPNLGK